MCAHYEDKQYEIKVKNLKHMVLDFHLRFFYTQFGKSVRELSPDVTLLLMAKA